MTEYARVDAVSRGDTLIADGGFTCMREGAELLVNEDERGLFVSCDEGKHYIDGQIEDNLYIGLTKKTDDV